MTFLHGILISFLCLIPFPGVAGTGPLDPLPCGIYDQSVKAFIEKDLETRSPDPARYTMALKTKGGKKLSVEVKNVETRMMPGERNHVTVTLDGKPFAKTSHQDVPLYLEVHVDNEKYRIICVRVEAPDVSGTGDEGEQQ